MFWADLKIIKFWGLFTYPISGFISALSYLILENNKVLFV
jgi:hypothetical protein